MRARHRLLAITISIVLVVVGSGAAEAYNPAVELFRFKDKRISESSGVVASSTQDKLLFTHNDSGDSAQFFAVNSFGCTLMTYALKGADAIDWEDMARGPDDAGRSSLSLADIGDNNYAPSDGVSVYRIAEPRVGMSRSGRACGQSRSSTVKKWTRFDLAYPDMPQDAETFLVHPHTGQLFIVTKTPFGLSNVYAAPDPLVPKQRNLLERVATFVFPLSDADPTFNPPYGAIGRFSATAGDVSPRADRVVIRTYTDAWEWPVRGGNITEAFSGTPARVLLPSTMQGEAIAYTRGGRSLLITSEGVNAPVHLIAG